MLISRDSWAYLKLLSFFSDTTTFLSNRPAFNSLTAFCSTDAVLYIGVDPLIPDPFNPHSETRTGSM